MVPLAAVDDRTIALFVHIAGVVVGFGCVFAYPLIGSYARRAGDAALLAHWHHIQERLGRMISAGMLVILAAGLYLVFGVDGPYDFGDPWIGTSFLILLIIGGVGGGYLAPTERRLAAMAEGGGGPQYEQASTTHQRVVYVLCALILVAIFLMVTKPGG